MPGAGNPQALNRYSYALNSPLNLIDPTGHNACGPDFTDAECDQVKKSKGLLPKSTGSPPIVVSSQLPSNSSNQAPTIGSVENDFGIDISGTSTWTDSQEKKRALEILQAQLENVGSALMGLLPGQWDSPEEAFKAILGGKLILHAENGGWNCAAGGKECWHGETGDTLNANGQSEIRLDVNFEELGRVILHEIGHAIEVLTRDNVPLTNLVAVMLEKDGTSSSEKHLISDYGWDDTHGMRTKNDRGGYNPQEYWADTFYLWVLDEHSASWRDLFANDYMSDYLQASLSLTTP